MRVILAEEMDVRISFQLPYAWSTRDSATTTWLNRAGSQVLDQDHPARYDPDNHRCTLCGHDVAYRADERGILHATLLTPQAVLGEIDSRPPWAIQLRSELTA